MSIDQHQFARLLPPIVDPPMPEGPILAEMLDNAAINRLYRAVDRARIEALQTRVRELEASVRLVAERNEELEDEVHAARQEMQRHDDDAAAVIADVTGQRDAALHALALRETLAATGLRPGCSAPAQRAIERASAVICNRTEHGGGGIGAVAGQRHIFLDQLLCRHMHGDEADLAALAVHAEMHHAPAAVQVTQPQAAELLAADAVIEQGGEDGAIAHALEGVLGRGVEQLAGLSVTERWRGAFIGINRRPLDAIDRITSNSVTLAEIIEQGRKRRELAANGGISQAASLELLAPGDDMGARHGAELGGTAQTGKGAELPDIDAVGLAGFGIGDVGKPFKLRRDLGEVAILRRRKHASRGRHHVPDLYQLISHSAAPVFPGPLFSLL